MKLKREHLILLGILGMAFAVRLYPIFANLPYTYWHDENNYVESALRLAGCNVRQLSFSHGGLYQFVLFVEYAIYFVVSKLMGIINSPTDFYISYLRDPSPFFLIARATSVFAGTAIAYLSYLIARRAYNVRVGLVACLFTAISFVMAQMSFMALADMLSVLILLISFLLFMRSADNPRADNIYYGACALFGLAVSCKYHTIFGVGALLIVAFIKAKTSGRGGMSVIRIAAFGSMAAVIGFFAGIPFSISNPIAFYNDTFVRMGGEYIVRNPNSATWLFYFTHHLRNGLGAMLEITALFGVAYAAYKRSRADILLLSFPVLFYALFMHSAGYAYHMLPAIPFILILGARLLDVLTEKIFPVASFSMLLLVSIIVVSPSFSNELKLLKILTSPDTRTESKRWIDENIPEGSKILIEGYASSVATHSPSINGNMHSIERDMADSIAFGGSGFSAKTKMSNFDRIFAGRKVYDVYKTVVFSEEDIRRYDPVYIVMTSDNDLFSSAELQYYATKSYLLNRERTKGYVNTHYKLIKSFMPTYDFTWWFPHFAAHDYAIIVNMPFSKLKVYTRGPRIDIFKKI